MDHAFDGNPRPQRSRCSGGVFGRLGFVRDEAGPDDYRMLSDGHGGFVHLNRAVASWLRAGVNPFGLYLCRKDVDALAAVFTGEIPEPGGPSDKPWGMHEFALNGPDDTLIRVGWPTRLR